MNTEKLQQFLADLERAHMSIAEMSVMTILLEGPIERMKIADFVKFEFRGDRPLEQPLDAYAQAVESCFEKQWIQAITLQEREEREARLTYESIPFVDGGIIGGVGEIDLSPEGYVIFRQAAGRRYPRSGVRQISPMCQLELYGDSEASSQDLARSYQMSNPKYPFNRGEGGWEIAHGTLTAVSNTILVGPWRFNRFEVVPQGFLTILQYKEIV